MQFFINARGFDSGATTSDGLVQSVHSYENVAIVSVYKDGIPLARIPVEIVEGVTLTCRVGASAEAETKGQLYQRRDRWLRRLNDDVGVAESIVGELNAMRGRSSAEALARAQEGLRALQTDVSSLTAERNSLGADWARDLPKADPLNLKEGEERLHYLQERRDELQRHIAALQDIITKEKDPRQAAWKDMVRRADLLEREAEFDKAIELYQRVLKDADAKNVPVVAKKLEKLQAHWALKDEAHRKARAFIYDVWPKQETAAQIKARLEEARKAFLTCKEAGDILTPQKLLKTYVVLTNHVVKEGDSLQPDAREDDLRKAKTIIALTDDLHKFNEDVKDYVANAKAPGE
jgi:tetratricopeptide (TPR) repeat protein